MIIHLPSITWSPVGNFYCAHNRVSYTRVFSVTVLLSEWIKGKALFVTIHALFGPERMLERRRNIINAINRG